MILRLAFDGSVDFAIATAYFWTGRQVQRRAVSGAAKPASVAFVVWWYALSVTGVFAGSLSLAVSAGLTDVPPARTLLQLSTVSFVVAMWALLRYLIYVLTGRLGSGLWLALVYVGYFAIVTYDETSRAPIGVDATGWRPVLVYASGPHASVATVLALLLVVPQVIMSLAYLGLVFRVRNARLRYRLALVAPTLLVWSAAVLFISRPELGPGDVVQVASRIFILVAAGALFLAYAPPPWIDRRLERQAP